MFFLVSGGAASGKTTVARAMRGRPGLESHCADELPAVDSDGRCRMLELWVQQAIAAQARGDDFLLAGHSPLGELLACPSAPELEAIAACVLDCGDVERLARIRARGVDPRWPPSQHTLNWAAWHRVHAADPQWEQHVIAPACPFPEGVARWAGWQAGDPRWDVARLDTTGWDVAETVARVGAWVEGRRARPGGLTAAARWWEAA